MRQRETGRQRDWQTDRHIDKDRCNNSLAFSVLYQSGSQSGVRVPHPQGVREKSEGVRQKFKVYDENANKYLPSVILLGGTWVFFFLLRGTKTGWEPLIYNVQRYKKEFFDISYPKCEDRENPWGIVWSPEEKLLSHCWPGSFGEQLSMPPPAQGHTSATAHCREP